MTSDHLFNEQELNDAAYEVFLQLAPDNLSEQDIELFNQYREQHGFIEAIEPSDKWLEFVEFEIEQEAYAEVSIGVEFDGQDHIFASMLISREKDAPFCHVIWRDKE